MSQTLLPPATPPGSSVSARRAAMVVDATPPATRPAPSPYEPDPPRRPSRFWRPVKWLLRQIIKAIYLTGSAAKRHRAAAVAIVVLVALLGGGTYAIYQYTHPAPLARSRSNPTSGTASPKGALANGTDTPFTIAAEPSIPLPSSVITFLHAWKTDNAAELESTLDPNTISGGTSFGGSVGTFSDADWQNLFQTLKSHNVIFDQFIDTGGYVNPLNGIGTYTVQAVFSATGQTSVGIYSWYFNVGTDGQIIEWLDLTPSAPAPQTSPTP